MRPSLLGLGIHVGRQCIQPGLSEVSKTFKGLGGIAVHGCRKTGKLLTFDRRRSIEERLQEKVPHASSGRGLGPTAAAAGGIEFSIGLGTLRHWTAPNNGAPHRRFKPVALRHFVRATFKGKCIVVHSQREMFELSRSFWYRTQTDPTGVRRVQDLESRPRFTTPFCKKDAVPVHQPVCEIAVEQVGCREYLPFSFADRTIGEPESWHDTMKAQNDAGRRNPIAEMKPRPRPGSRHNE